MIIPISDKFNDYASSIYSKLKENNVHFFDVVDKHKVLFSAMRRQGPLGENPSFSIQMKYFIRKIEENDSTELRIEIFDDSDNLIRYFSSEEKTKYMFDEVKNI